MLRRLSIVFCLVALTGCRNPMRVATNSKICGAVNVNLPNRPIEVDLPARPFKVEMGTLAQGDAASLVEMPVGSNSDSASRVAIVDVDGVLLNRKPDGSLMGLGENPVSAFREKLDYIRNQPAIRAVVLRINSPGGGVTATDIMRRDLLRFKQDTQLPVVACLMDVGTGGAYYLASAADRIVAHPTTITGGMGVILNLYNLEDALRLVSILPDPLRSGENVDLGTPIRELSEDSREILQDIASDFHERLRDAILDQRHVADDDELFDGRVFTAAEARSLGLVDDLGYVDDAIAKSSELAQCGAVSTVMLRRPKNPAHSQYDSTANNALLTGLLSNMPGLDRSRLPTFLYIWQPDPSLATAMGK